MGEFLDQIPEKVKSHIRDITKSSGLEEADESVEMIAEGWLEKNRVFEEESVNQNMEEVEFFERNDERGAIALTYSGSLINIGPISEGTRKAGYASIGLRKDVPDLLSNDDSELGDDISIDKPIEFAKGPVKRTSPIYKIIVCKDDLSVEEQEEKLDEATMVMMDEFVEVNNKTLFIDD